jgi:CRISPR system Cascade subunit CasA
MNLLEERWMPVRLHDGEREWVAPHQLSDPRIAAFDADRADFNGALAQFAIGLLQTTTPVDSSIEWRALFNNPPDGPTLQEWFLPCKAAFEFDGDGARFMQDFDLRPSDGEPLAIGGLLIETPGENALKNNTDHFVKRSLNNRFCHGCAALALFSIQTNGASRGTGYRTGLRGGGPLTTLLLTEQRRGSAHGLWHDLWLNVQERDVFLSSGGDPEKKSPRFTFPWLDSMYALQSRIEDAAVAPVQAHPAHVFWSMPQRIRVDFEEVSAGTCDICNRESTALVHRFVTRNQGLNYKGPWSHPLSPYYESKEGWLPVHPQPGGLGYKHWLGWVLGIKTDREHFRQAGVISQFFKNQVATRVGVGLRLWAFGYDLSNAKVRCWYEASMPLYALSECDPSIHNQLREEVSAWLAGAGLSAAYARGAVRDAWFGGEARGKFDFVDAAFWGHTEPMFYELLRTRIQAARGGLSPDRQATAERWRSHLRTAALRLFDKELVGTGPIERQNPARIAKAHHQLSLNLDGPKLRAALGLPAKSNPKPKKTKDAQAA